MSQDDFETPHRPVEIRYLKAERQLEIDWDNGVCARYGAEYLRVESPSAEVKGHGPGQERLVYGRRHVAIIDIEPVGHYAIRLVFDDLHDTGIYSWRYLWELYETHDTRWAAYLAALDAAGRGRDPM